MMFSGELGLPVILIGGGGHGRVLLEILQRQSRDILGYTDLRDRRLKVPYLGTDDVLNQYGREGVCLVNGIGSVRRPVERQRIFETLKNRGFCFLSVIHPQAIVADGVVEQMGEGAQIIAGAVVNPGAILCDNVIVNTSASIDHDCYIGAHSHIAPGVVLSGDVRVGSGCHIGTGAKIIQGIQIGDGVLVAAGAIVRKDIPKNKVFYGESPS
jgi:UDP-perosamine 4-acetyltransferase